MQIDDRIKNMLEEKGQNSRYFPNIIIIRRREREKERERERERARERERELGSWMSEIFAEYGNSWPSLNFL